MLLTFSHILNNQRAPLLDGEGREVTLSIDGVSKTEAINSQQAKEFVVDKGNEVRVRRVL
jgi:hypothetical protein